MPKFVLTDARIYAGGVDLSCNANTVELSAESAAQEVTSFCSEGWTENIGGLKSVTISSGGQWEAGDRPVDDALWSGINGGAPVPWLVAPHELAAGDVAYTTEALQTTYSLGGDVGAVAPWEAEAAGDGRLSRGTVEQAGVVSASGSSAGREITTSSGQLVYVNLHVVAVSDGGSVQVDVERDVDNTFAAPTVVASSASYTAPGSEILEITPAADTWYRVTWTVSGTAQFAAVFSVA